MRILLFGEYSGLFNHLKAGLQLLGHEVVTASDGNGYKNFERDVDWRANQKLGRFMHAVELCKVYEQRAKLKGYDVVLLISPSVFSRYRFVNKPVVDFLLKNNDKVFLSGAGMTPVVARYWYNSTDKYHNYLMGNIKDNPSLSYRLDEKASEWEYELLDRIDGYIPIWYEYAQPFRGHPRMTRTLRIPIDLSKLEYVPNVVKGKIVFFHGIPSRHNAKGTQYIRDAFSRMEKKYGDVAEFVCAGGLPFNEYMKIVERTNVILDDANSCSIAMNGLFSLAKGKIVMGGAEPVANKELGLEWNPVYNLCPDVDQICSCIEDVIEKRDQIEEMGKKCREFVEHYHNCKDIAAQYIEVFNNYHR